MPVEQVVPPSRTLYVPFSVACQVTLLESEGPTTVFETPSIVTTGAVVSFVTVVA